MLPSTVLLRWLLSNMLALQSVLLNYLLLGIMLLLLGNVLRLLGYGLLGNVLRLLRNMLLLLRNVLRLLGYGLLGNMLLLLRNVLLLLRNTPLNNGNGNMCKVLDRTRWGGLYMNRNVLVPMVTWYLSEGLGSNVTCVHLYNCSWLRRRRLHVHMLGGTGGGRLLGTEVVVLR